MLEDYFFLVRRIPGLSLSPSDFWELDTWTTAKLISLERDVMKREQDALNGKEEYVEQSDKNDPKLNDLVNRMSVVVD